MTPPVLALAVFAAFATHPSAPGDDWPGYFGPNGDRTVPDAPTPAPWGAGGPLTVWSVPAATGFSSYSVGGGRAYTLVQAEVDGDPREVCVAHDVADGRELWRTPLGAARYDGGADAGTSDNRGGDGPRSTPAYDADEDAVVVLDAQLGLFCLDGASGDLRWHHDLEREYDGRNIRWQSAASPLVEGEHVFVAGGGEGQSLMAFRKESGERAWAVLDEAMTHATPIATTLHGVRQVVFLVQSGLVALEPSSGRELWRAPYPYKVSTGASPVVWEDLVYVSAGYGVGAGVYRVERGDDGAFAATLLWRKPNKLVNHWSTPVVRNGHLYGMFSFKKYGEGPLQCVDLRSGDVLWSRDGFGPGNVVLLGDSCIALSDAGELVLFDADPAGYSERARHDVLEGKCWSMPAYADGRLYLRSTSAGVCLELGTAE